MILAVESAVLLQAHQSQHVGYQDHHQHVDAGHNRDPQPDSVSVEGAGGQRAIQIGPDDRGGGWEVRDRGGFEWDLPRVPCGQRRRLRQEPRREFR